MESNTVITPPPQTKEFLIDDDDDEDGCNKGVVESVNYDSMASNPLTISIQDDSVKIEFQLNSSDSSNSDNSNTLNNNINSSHNNNNNESNTINYNVCSKTKSENVIVTSSNGLDVKYQSTSHQQITLSEEHVLLSPGESSLTPTTLSPCRQSNDSGGSISITFNNENIGDGDSPNDIRTTDELDELSRIIEQRPHIIEKWLREKASNDAVARIHAVTGSTRTAHSPKRASVTSDLFQQWLQNSPIKRNRSPTSRGSIGSRKHLQSLDEGELFMELIRDVANELDIDILCHKILVNVGLLTHADRGSLFLAKGPPGARYLVAKLFDVTQDTAFDDAVKRAKAEEIIIPFGIGIAGHVAQTKETINIKEAYKDPRFNCEIDLKTGYKTHVILSMPICNYEGDVIGVAQIINKTNGTTEFSERDVEVFRRYLTFCGIGVQNAQLFEMSVQEYRRNQILLNLARSIFEEQNNLECLVTKIMTEARELLKCERCAVYLLDLDCCESKKRHNSLGSKYLSNLAARLTIFGRHYPTVLKTAKIWKNFKHSRNQLFNELNELVIEDTFESHLERIVERPSQSRQPLSRRLSHNVNVEDILQQQKSSDRFTMLFELELDNQSANVSRPTVDDTDNSTLAQIAQYISSTGVILNIHELDEWLKDKHEIRRSDETNAKNILCMPIFNGQKTIIGVAQLINKVIVEGNELNQFTDSDVSIFEAFAIFCGLGIHNTQMYENACKLMAKQKVALECLSYHATAPQEQTLKLVQDVIPSAEAYSLYSFNFSDFDLNDDDTCRATIRMFLQCNLVQQFHIPYDVLCRWVLSVRKNYRPVKYHNWRHALNVTQTMFAMMKTGKMERFLTDLEILGMLVACLCHDLDHRGTNNSFQTKTDSPLAILYSTSTMEHHHFDQCIMILNSEGNNIFQALSPDDYRRVMKIVETAILSTDLAMYFKKRNSFLELIENGEFDWQSEEKKDLLCGMMMTACDVSAIAKPWEVQHKVAKMVADEFFDQGDLEKLQLNTQPIAMMDRERKDELPKMQVGFIDVICMPLYRVLSETFPWIKPLYEGTVENRQHWQDLAEKVEMGLTWIDHDTIDKPVEEFSACSDEIKDIEFTVTTLNCTHGNDQKDEHHTPSHERRPKFSSLRKSSNIGKVVKAKLAKSFYNSTFDNHHGSTESSHVHHQQHGSSGGTNQTNNNSEPSSKHSGSTKQQQQQSHHTSIDMKSNTSKDQLLSLSDRKCSEETLEQSEMSQSKSNKRRSKLCHLL